MCRFTAYIGANPILLADLITRPSRSIIRQSFDCRERTQVADRPSEAFQAAWLNGDGFGIGWYGEADGSDPGLDITPCVFKELKPAWNSCNLEHLAEKIESKLFLAHIRAAGPGSKWLWKLVDCCRLADCLCVCALFTTKSASQRGMLPPDAERPLHIHAQRWHRRVLQGPQKVVDLPR